MATEYISRDAALACFSDWIDRYGHEHTADEMVEYQKIEALPAADVVEVVRARWIEIDEYVLCPKCGTAEHSPNRNFCHACGADMREVLPCTS